VSWELPSGTITFLFTDIEGSTRLLHELGADAYARALTEHRRVLRAAFAAHRGVEVDTQGDAFFVAFPSAPDAVAAAQAAQEALPPGPVRVRIGLHTGTPKLAEEGYVGADVHLGARIAAAGHGGQVLLSKATRELADGEFADLGDHRLKDFTEPVWLFQLGSERFPPLKTISNTNLPRPASSFVGRERELAEVTSLLHDARLITLTGPGGSGKTRLAIEAAAGLVPEFKAGVFWVGLAALRDPALVTETIAQTLGAKDGLAEHIGERELLLLLDNLEQVVEAAPELAALVETCPNLELLVTSRELLRVRGELEYAVPPLTEPEAVELFCERAHAQADETIAELCRRLDNLPLAVELAAARARVLSPQQILDRLAQRLDLLKGGRDAEARQQTLRAAIEWSYDLLSAEEQELFRRMAVFAGGCTLEAAEQVAEADLDTLQSLVNKSLVRRTDERFWMLETIREFALDRLAESGEQDEVARAHANYFRALAERAETTGEASYAAGWLERLDGERDNFRAAIRWALDAGEPLLALRTVIALTGLWTVRGVYREWRSWLTEALDAAPEAPAELRATALRDLGATFFFTSDHEQATAVSERALELFRELGDTRAVASMLDRLAAPAGMTGDHEKSRAFADESLALFRELGDRQGALYPLSKVAWDEWKRGDPEVGLVLAEEALALAREFGDTWWQAGLLPALAEMMRERGELERAVAAGGECVSLARELGDARTLLYGLGTLALLAAADGDAVRAGRLWGAVETLEARGEARMDDDERARYREEVFALAGAELETGIAEGRAITVEDAIEYALAPPSAA
jgi:predicted ATPase